MGAGAVGARMRGQAEGGAGGASARAPWPATPAVASARPRAPRPFVLARRPLPRPLTAMHTMAMRSVVWRPQTSPMEPKMRAPRGRTTKPTAYTAHHSSVWAVGLVCGGRRGAGAGGGTGEARRAWWAGAGLGGSRQGGGAGQARDRRGPGGSAATRACLGEEHLLQHTGQLGVLQVNKRGWGWGGQGAVRNPVGPPVGPGEQERCMHALSGRSGAGEHRAAVGKDRATRAGGTPSLRPLTV